MNQVLKSTVYGKGNSKQIDFLATIGGMTDIERKVFQMLHEGHDAEYIKAELYIDRKKYEDTEESVRYKLTIAVFECINSHMAKA